MASNQLGFRESTSFCHRRLGNGFVGRNREDNSRVRSGLLPAFFDFNVEVTRQLVKTGLARWMRPFFPELVVSSMESAAAIVVEPVTGVEYPFYVMSGNSQGRNISGHAVYGSNHRV